MDDARDEFYGDLDEIDLLRAEPEDIRSVALAIEATGMASDLLEDHVKDLVWDMSGIDDLLDLADLLEGGRGYVKELYQVAVDRVDHLDEE